MASVNKRVLLSATELTAASTTGSAVSLDNREVDHVGVLIVSGKHADTVLDVKVQTSADGTTWHDWITFTQQGAGTSVNELKLPASSIPGLSKIRYVVALSGSTKEVTVQLELAHRDS